MNQFLSTEEKVKQYYDRNTRRFLWIGGLKKPLAIHRAVWGPGVHTRADALEYSNRLVLEELKTELQACAEADFQVLDLGCGVGGTLLFLVQAAPVQAVGVTLSPVQAAIARQNAVRLGLSDRCAFHAASYLHLPPLSAVHLAVAIESFVLGPDPARFFDAASAALSPGAKLIVIDDFLSTRAAESQLHPRQQHWVTEFKTGWLANSLVTPLQAAHLAEKSGFSLIAGRDLTPYLRLLGLRDRVVQAVAWLSRFLPVHALLGKSYLGSLVGGNALQHGLRHGIFEYHLLVFQKIR